MNGNYPYYLKQRISGDDGHLSNTQALELFTKHRSSLLEHLILAHLSKNNNSPELVERLFSQQAGSTRITVASRYQETAVFSIHKGNQPARIISKKRVPDQNQLSLF